jgi:mRNA interferase MazF
MDRDYKEWHQLKSDLGKRASTQQFRSKEIWWCTLGANVGDEEDGKNKLFERPILVFRKYNKSLFFGLPMTSSLKANKFYFPLDVNGMARSVILSQGRTLSGFRLTRRIYKLSDRVYAELQDAYIKITLEKTISTDCAVESPVPNGSLYSDNTKTSVISQERKE